MPHLSWSIVLLLGLSCKAPAQAPAEVPDDLEAKFLAETVKSVNAFATYTLQAGYPQRAKEAYREVLAEYDQNDPVARKALGFVRVGTAWAPEPDFRFPAQDKPDAAVAAAISRRWKALAENAGQGHREQAVRLQKAGRAARARWHFDRVLRFLPADPTAGAARGLASFEGLNGTPRDLEILKRSRMMDRALDREMKKTYPVTPIPADTKNRYLVKAGKSFGGFQTANFRVYGDWEDEVLRDAALHAERSWAFCAEVFAKQAGYSPAAGPRNLAFCKSREDWVTVVKANAELLGTGAAFVLEHTSACLLGSGPDMLQVAGVEDPATVLDLAVRWPAQAYAGLASDALHEGVGHAIVGRFFGRNLVFLVGQQRAKKDGRTVAGGIGAANEPPKVILPDLASWEQAAVENAWRDDGTPVARLPLVSAAEFPDDGRIKAWSFVDYMLRRSPSELKSLDATRSAKHEREVAEKYAALQAGGDVQELELSWRKFWTDDTPLLQAIRNKTTPLEAASKDAPQWLEAFNAARLQALAPIVGPGAKQYEVGWNASYSTDCKQHVEYLKKNKGERGPAKENTEKPELPGGSNTGRAFAHSALVNTAPGDHKKILAQWMAWPGYRDALLNRSLTSIGLYADGPLLVMDVNRGQIAQERVPITVYPNENCRQINPTETYAVPHQVEVKELGPDVEDLLRRHGQSKASVLGFPISIHFTSGGAKEGIACQVTQNGQPVKGMLHIATAGASRRAVAAGLVVFYASQPLKRGAVYQVHWTWKGGENKAFTFETL